MSATFDGVTFLGLVSSDPHEPNALDSVLVRCEDDGSLDRLTIDELRELAAQTRDDAENEARTDEERAIDRQAVPAFAALLVEAEVALMNHTPSARIMAWATGSTSTEGN